MMNNKKELVKQKEGKQFGEIDGFECRILTDKDGNPQYVCDEEQEDEMSHYNKRGEFIGWKKKYEDTVDKILCFVSTHALYHFDNDVLVEDILNMVNTNVFYKDDQAE